MSSKPSEPLPALQPHASSDLAARRLKGYKIEQLAGLAGREGCLKMLEIGTGSGGIASYFGTHPSLDCVVDAVDVTDTRCTFEGYAYCLLDGTALPFSDSSYDVVISNHVIEHVGSDVEQRNHLSEIFRVLHDEGVCYLAVPSRWMLVEPHFKLPFLSWLPQSLANAYVRASGKGAYYDCRPLGSRTIERLLREAGFLFEQQHVSALKLHFESERSQSLLYRFVLKWLPDWFVSSLRRAFPTFIYILKKPSNWPSQRIDPRPGSFK